MGRRGGTCEGDYHVAGVITCEGFVPPTNSITNNSLVANAGVETSKLVHRHLINLRQAPGSAVVAATYDIHIARAAGVLRAIEAVITGTVASGADRTITIDLLKSTGGGAFASVLSPTLVLDNTNVVRVLETGAINTTAFVDGDLYRVTVAVAGSAGNQADGFSILITIDENAQ